MQLCFTLGRIWRSGVVSVLEASPSSEHDDLPAPSPELILWRLSIQAHLATAHLPRRRRARAFLEQIASGLADEEAFSTLTVLRPPADHAALTRARRQAVRAFRALLPMFTAKLPPEPAPDPGADI